MHHTGKKERKKEKEKKKGYDKSASKGFEPKPSELAKSVNQHFSPLDQSCTQSMVIDSFQEWLFRFCVELNL